MHVYRLAAWDTPFWIGPNRASGRFHPAGRGPVQYWSLNPLTPWAEYLHSQGIRSADELLHLRLRLWAAEVATDAVTIDFDSAAQHDLAPEHLVTDDPTDCQRFGRRCLEGAGPDAIIVPSAALPGTRNLVLFGPRVAAPYGSQPVDDLDAPTAVAAEDAHALVGLLPLVRHLGDPHLELEAWRAGMPFDVPAPSTALSH